MTMHIHRVFGSAQTPVRSFLDRHELTKNSVLSWVEPRMLPPAAVTPGAIPDQLLVSGPPQGSFPLDEARVYITDGVLAVVASDTGCCWSLCRESPFDGSAPVPCVRSEDRAIYRRDWQRFGLMVGAMGDLRLIEYRSEGQLVAYRLALKEGRQ